MTLAELAVLISGVRERLEKDIFLVSINGASGVSKSTTVREIRATLETRGISTESIETDGFLYPKKSMLSFGMDPKRWNGFPESFDLRRLWSVVSRLKKGYRSRVPIYDHYLHDISPKYKVVVPKQVIFLEGLHPLQAPNGEDLSLRSLLDLIIYVGPVEGEGDVDFLLQSRLKREVERERITKQRYGFSRTKEEIVSIFYQRDARSYQVVKRVRQDAHISILLGRDYSIDHIEFRSPVDLSLIDPETFLGSFDVIGYQ